MDVEALTALDPTPGRPGAVAAVRLRRGVRRVRLRKIAPLQSLAGTARLRTLRRPVRLGVACILSALVAGCGRADAGGGGTVVVGMRNDFGGFNPITNSDLYTGEVINFGLYTPLIRYDANLKISPWLAESWDEQGDTAVVFHLRHDVRWHDGPPVTAEDVAFTFDRAKQPESASLLASAFLSNVASVEVIDSFTVRFRYVCPHAQALEDFWWAPAPKHLLENTAAADLRNAPFNRAPVGSGPYRFVEWRANERLVLERNPDFPDALGGPPAVERLILRIIPDASTMLTELITGAIQVDVPVLPDQVESIRADSRLKLIAYPGRTVYYLGWNDARPPFDDARVRRALALAIDRREIIDALLHGQGVLATSPIPPWSPVYPAGVEPVPFSPDVAGRLLDAAGWKDRDGDGIRENRAGNPLRFTLLTADDQLRRSVVEVVQSQLRRVGADIDVRVVEFQTMIADHRNRDFDAIFTNWILDNFQVAASPFALFHSSQADVPRSANRSGVRDPTLDRLIEQAAAATDPDEQTRIWRDFIARLQDRQPVTFMFWLNELAGVSASVGGVTMDPRGELLTVGNWTASR
jgi:peptide/nickel transport system substrate-binding protein